MKGKYTKPLVMMESFSLTGGLLRDCSPSIPKDNLTSGDVLSCTWELGEGMNIFLLTAACNMDGESMDFACYNNPDENSYIFRS